jgi:hypothetical protein
VGRRDGDRDGDVLVFAGALVNSSTYLVRASRRPSVLVLDDGPPAPEE